MEGLQITENAVLNGPRPERLRKCLLELDDEENIVPNWTFKKTSSRIGWSMLVRTDLSRSGSKLNRN